MLSKLGVVKKILIIMLTCFVSVGSASAYYIKTNYLDNFDHDDKEYTSEELGINTELNNDITNIALFGIDSREDEQSRSDSIMIISIDNLHNKVKLISIMRDSLVSVDGKYRKINEAYFYGGPELAMKTLNETFNLNISEYATVNFEGMAEIIDAVDGVTVDITEEEVKNANGSISEQAYYAGVEPTFIEEAGEGILLNGMQAVGFARIRKVETVDGVADDYGRTDRQRYIMEQLFNKALEMDVTQYPKFAKALLPYVKTSLDLNEILGLAGILGNGATFEQTRVPFTEYTINAGYSYNGQSCVYYNTDYAADIIHAFIYDDIAPEDYMLEHEPVMTGALGGSGASEDTTTKNEDSESSSSSKSSSKNYSSQPSSSSEYTEPSSSTQSSSSSSKGGGTTPSKNTDPSIPSSSEPVTSTESPAQDEN